MNYTQQVRGSGVDQKYLYVILGDNYQGEWFIPSLFYSKSLDKIFCYTESGKFVEFTGQVTPSLIQSYEAFPVEDASGGTITFSIGGPQAAFQQILQDLLN